MGTRKGMEVSIGIAEAAMWANVDVIPAYPITPQTPIYEKLSELEADGETPIAECRLSREYGLDTIHEFRSNKGATIRISAAAEND